MQQGGLRMGKDKQAVPEGGQLPLEELFQNLEEVIGKLEGEDVNLEESFRLYQKGMELLKQCNTVIDAVEKKVLILDENGETHPFQDGEDNEQ